MALNSNALTTFARAKNYLKIPSATALDADQTDMIELMINAASEFVHKYCDRLFKAQALTEIHHGRKQNILLLKQWPVNSITSLTVDNDGVFTDVNDIWEPEDYKVGDDQNSLVLLNNVFPSGYNNIQVVYNAGYATIPSDLELATLWAVFWYYGIRRSDDIGRPRKGKGDESTEIDQDMPDHVREILDSYKRTEMPFSGALTFNE